MVIGLKDALRLSCIAGAIYLALVLMAILLEVRMSELLFGSLVFYSRTAILAMVTIVIHWRVVGRKCFWRRAGVAGLLRKWRERFACMS